VTKAPVFRLLIRVLVSLLRPLWTALWLRPAATTHLRGSAADLARSKPELQIRDNDGKFGPAFARLARASGIRIVRTPVRTPRANGIIERFHGSVRRECRDHVLILVGRHMHQVLCDYARYFNQARSHQGIQQAMPDPSAGPQVGHGLGTIRAGPILRWSTS
jgi:transposase InsO family protein